MDASSYIMNRMNRRSQMVNLPTLLETLHSRNCSVKFLAIYDVPSEAFNEFNTLCVKYHHQVIALCNGTSGYDLAKDLLRKKNDAFDGVAIDVKLAVGNAQDFINYAKTTNFPIHEESIVFQTVEEIAANRKPNMRRRMNGVDEQTNLLREAQAELQIEALAADLMGGLQVHHNA
ncbi:hypothetical protein P8452_77188 [Trifolium repens]|nr:hypothetical protein P8452_77188 [Trifolium repens]